MTQAVGYEIVETRPDWAARGSVDYASSPEICFVVQPPIELVDQFSMQMEFDRALQESTADGLDGRVIEDMKRSYKLSVDHSPDGETSLVRCVFWGCRRSQLASSTAALGLVENILTEALKVKEKI